MSESGELSKKLMATHIPTSIQLPQSPVSCVPVKWTKQSDSKTLWKTLKCGGDTLQCTWCTCQSWQVTGWGYYSLSVCLPCRRFPFGAQDSCGRQNLHLKRTITCIYIQSWICVCTSCIHWIYMNLFNMMTWTTNTRTFFLCILYV